MSATPQPQALLLAGETLEAARAHYIARMLLVRICTPIAPHPGSDKEVINIVLPQALLATLPGASEEFIGAILEVERPGGRSELQYFQEITSATC